MLSSHVRGIADDDVKLMFDIERIDSFCVRNFDVIRQVNQTVAKQNVAVYFGRIEMCGSIVSLDSPSRSFRSKPNEQALTALKSLSTPKTHLVKISFLQLILA